MNYLAKLGSKENDLNDAPKSHPPFIFTLIQKCIKYEISYNLMCSMNYKDLIYLVIEYDIAFLEGKLKEMEQSRLNKKGYEYING